MINHVPHGLLGIGLVSALLVFAGVLVLARRARKRREWNATDVVDIAVEDSFPASDPPAWTMGRG